MFTINGQEFEVYAIDSLDTLKDRIASLFGTLYKYLKFSPREPKDLQDFVGDYTADDLLKEIINQDDISFELTEKVLTDYPQLDIVKDVEEPFIAFNTAFKDNPIVIHSATGFSVNVQDVWDKRSTIREKLLEKIKDTADRYAKHEKLHKQFDNVRPVPYTQFHFERTKYLIDFGSADQTIEELFDTLVVTDFVPFIVLNDVYKVKSDFTPSAEMVSATYPSGYIVMKVNGERETGIREVKDVYRRYSDAIFTIDKGRLVATFVVYLGKRNVDRVEFQRRTLQTFGSPNLEMVSYKDTNTSGIFYCPHQSLDTTVWSDMVMNNPIFYGVLAVDESVRISKTKRNVFMKAIYGQESFAMQMHVGEKGDLPPGIMDRESYVRVRIAKTSTAERIGLLQNLLAKLLTVYNKEYRTIADIYRGYLPSFKPEPLVTAAGRQIVSNPRLGEIAPEVFPPRYSRHCKKSPIVISDEEAATTSKVVMKFPIHGEAMTRNYICPLPDAPYPGLQINRLPENNDVFPFLPCCYAKDQRYKSGSAYNNYYKNEQLRRGTQIQDIFRTGKILPLGAVGVMPNKINAFFNTILPPDKQIMRRGVTLSRLSFLEAVLFAKKIINGGKEMTRANTEVLADEIKLISQSEFAAAAKQELYGKSIDDILQIMLTGDLRATWFVNVLEILYDCNIYVFTDDDNGVLAIPDHTMLYYKFRPKRDVILVYQHWGSEIDTPQYPHCELMVVVDRDNVKNQQLMFPFDSPVAQTLSRVFGEMVTKYTTTSVHTQTYIDMRTIPVMYQSIDTCGKCRMICTIMDGVNMTVMLPPCPPFAKVIDNTIHRPSLDAVMKLVDHYKLKVVEQRKNADNRTVELVVSLGSIEGVFLIDDRVHLKNIPLVSQPEFEIYYSNVDAPLREAAVLEKTSRVLSEVAVWSLSRFGNGSKFTTDMLKQFAADHFAIDANVDYRIDEMRPYFDDGSNRMIVDGRIVVPNIEVMKRLIYHMRMFGQTMPDKFLTYKDLRTIPSFFSRVADFEDATGEYVLAKQSAVENLIKTKKRDANWVAVDHVLPDTNEPYFFQNNLVDRRVFIAQNAPSYLHANYIVSEWRARRVNPGNFFRIEESVAMPHRPASPEVQGLEIFDMDINELLGEQLPEQPQRVEKQEVISSAVATEAEIIAPILPDVPLLPFKVYKYVSATDISPLRGDGNQSVLAYKVDNQPRYTVLLAY